MIIDTYIGKKLLETGVYHELEMAFSLYFADCLANDVILSKTSLKVFLFSSVGLALLSPSMSSPLSHCTSKVVRMIRASNP